MIPFIRAFSGEQRNQNRVGWRRVDGLHMEHDDWDNQEAVALHLGIDQDGDELLYLINQSKAPARFKLPKDEKQRWITLCNTSLDQVVNEIVSKELLLPPMSLAVLHTAKD
jgi:glycogen operon protein